jgi:hypothetical protein
MSYSFDLLLKQESHNTWQLMTKAGKIFHEFLAPSIGDAKQYAEAYMSSWASVRIEFYNEQEERNNLSNKT